MIKKKFDEDSYEFTLGISVELLGQNYEVAMKNIIEEVNKLSGGNVTINKIKGKTHHGVICI